MGSDQDPAIVHDDASHDVEPQRPAPTRSEGSATLLGPGDLAVLRTKTGRILTEDDIAALVAEAEAGYDVTKLRAAQNRRS